MPLPTNRQTLDTVEAADINGIAAAVNRSASGAGIAVPASWWYLLTGNDNASTKLGATQGNEYAIGVNLGEGNIDRVAMQVSVAGSAGTVFRIGLRPIDGVTIGAPLLDVAFDGAVGGVQIATVSASLTAGTYALTWVRYGDTGDTCTVMRTAITNRPHLFPLQAASGNVATGHGPYHAILNTGISGALPSTITRSSVTTNQEGGNAPYIELRRA